VKSRDECRGAFRIGVQTVAVRDEGPLRKERWVVLRGCGELIVQAVPLLLGRGLLGPESGRRLVFRRQGALSLRIRAGGSEQKDARDATSDSERRDSDSSREHGVQASAALHDFVGSQRTRRGGILRVDLECRVLDVKLVVKFFASV